MSTPWSSLLWFGVILALIPATLWFVKRTPLGGAGSGHVLKSIAVMPLSTSQRIVTVEVGSGDARRWLVLGITPSSITTLHEMAPVEGAGEPMAMGPVPPFAQLLGRFKRGDAGPA